MANSTAVVPLPGTPKVNIGTKAPDAAPLLPASGAAIPLGSPSPKCPLSPTIFFSKV